MASWRRLVEGAERQIAGPWSSATHAMAGERDHVHCKVLAKASSRSCNGRLGLGAGAIVAIVNQTVEDSGHRIRRRSCRYTNGCEDDRLEVVSGRW